MGRSPPLRAWHVRLAWPSPNLSFVVVGNMDLKATATVLKVANNALTTEQRASNLGSLPGAIGAAQPLGQQVTRLWEAATAGSPLTRV